MNQKMSHRGKGYRDGKNGLQPKPPHATPKGKAQEKYNEEYMKGLKHGREEFQKKWTGQ